MARSAKPVDDQTIVAALLWDLPALNRAASDSARTFAQVMGPPPHDEVEVVEGDALGMAAAALQAERSNQAERAISLWNRIAVLGPAATVLSVCLASFSQLDVGIEPISQGADVIRGVDPPELRARLALKLATYAFDRQAAELFFSLLERAELDSSPDTRFGRLVRGERASALGQIAFPPGSPQELPADSLVDLPWIDDLALGAAQEHIDNAMVARARDPWSWTFHAGQTALDRIIAAERQATWAGSLWTRRPLRKQIGAQLLSPDPPLR